MENVNELKSGVIFYGLYIIWRMLTY